MTSSETPVADAGSSPPSRPAMPPFARWLMRVTGLIAILLFLTPTVYVIKYYAFDRPQEARRAALVNTAYIAQSVPVHTIAPPLVPEAKGNAALYYTRAIQSYSDRLAASHQPSLLFPAPREVSDLFEGARRKECHFFNSSAHGKPLFIYQDPGMADRAVPYRFPIFANGTHRYLDAAIALTDAMAYAAQSTPRDRHQLLIGEVLVRFGHGLGRERATRRYLQASYAIQRVGLRLMVPFAGKPLQRYVDSLEMFEEAMQAKYALLEPTSPDNIALQEKVAQHDADPMWRREAIWALGATINAPTVAWRRPLEAMTGKVTLVNIATHDNDSTVRQAASAALGQIAQGKAAAR